MEAVMVGARLPAMQGKPSTLLVCQARIHWVPPVGAPLQACGGCAGIGCASRMLLLAFELHCAKQPQKVQWHNKTVWPSGLRRWLQAPVRTGVGSNPTAVIP